MTMLKRIGGLALGAAMVSGVACASIGGRGGVNPNQPVPDSFLVRFETSRGPVDVMARKSWAPIGVDRFYTLVQNHYYDEAGFFRVVKGFVAQFGLAADPRVTNAWRIRAIADEPVKHGNTRGTLAYARGGPGTRTTQLFFNLVNNARLDTSGTIGFPAIAEVVSGMEHIDSLYYGYGNAAPRPRANGAATTATRDSVPPTGPQQDSISRLGNSYLARGWPKLDYVRSARVIREWRSSP